MPNAYWPRFKHNIYWFAIYKVNLVSVHIRKKYSYYNQEEISINELVTRTQFEFAVHHVSISTSELIHDYTVL